MTGRGDADLETALDAELAAREAAAFVHAGADRDPTLRYCVPSLERGVHAVAFDGAEWRTVSARDGSSHPAATLASRLAEDVDGTVLTPARIPHDAALYLERAGFDLASTDVVERARATKTPAERERVANAQAAASAGVRAAASLLADATVVDGRLEVDGDPLTPAYLRVAADEAVVAAGAFPAGNTAVDADAAALRPGAPIVLAVAPRGPAGYHGGLVRTLVVDGNGGRERRAHVAATRALRSARALLEADAASVAAVEADLEAEVRAFGFGEADDVETRVAGVGLEPSERPLAGGDEIERGAVVRLEAAVRVDDRWLRIADLLETDADGVRWLESLSRSLAPSALLE